MTGSTKGKNLGEGKRNTEMHPLPYLAENVLFQDTNLWEVFNLTKFIILRFGRKIILSHLFFFLPHGIMVF